MSHYDRDVDIAALNLEGFDGGHAYGEQHEWGVLLRERETDQVIGIELWKASGRLPSEVLEGLPGPTPPPVEAEAAKPRS